MPFAIRPNRFTWNVNSSVASGTYGVSVIPGASNVEGGWTSIITGANLTNDVCEVVLYVANGNSSGASKEHLIDIGIDPAGGTSYTAIVSNLAVGESGGGADGGRRFRFPVRIPAGSQIAVRVQGANATAGTVRVAIQCFGLPSNPEAIRVGSFSETIGTITNSSGVSFIPGNAADGTWALLGVTTNELWWWQIGGQCDNAALAAVGTQTVDLAYGDATNKTIIIEDFFLVSQGTEIIHNTHAQNCYCEVPAGSNIYIRSRAHTAPDTGWNAVAVGIGGDA